MATQKPPYHSAATTRALTPRLCAKLSHTMPRKKKGTVLDKIILVIRSQPPAVKGVSRSAITKYLKSELDCSNASAVKKAFQAGISSGKLIQTGQSFRVAGDPMPEIPPDETVDIVDVTVGTGSEAKSGCTVVVGYEGHLDNFDGPVFDKSSKFAFGIGAGDVIKGWDMGINGMKVGGVRELVVPAKLGYGKRGSPPEIPGNATLYFKVSLKSVH